MTRNTEPRMVLQPYHAGSSSAKTLARRLGIKRLKLVSTSFRPRGYDLVVNWGSAKKLFDHHYYLNDPSFVSQVADKLLAMRLFQTYGITQPEFTEDPDEAQGWLGDGETVVARAILRGHSGQGITIVRPGDVLPPDCPLYTKYVKKSKEYRVHVFRDDIICVQEKRKRNGAPEVQDMYQVRNYRNGWVYCINEVDPPEQVLEEAVAAVDAACLDFGAVDVGWNNHYGRADVYEINTAPGLHSPTLVEAYANSLSRIKAELLENPLANPLRNR
jgi:glutathione synthase/RimK-type ligase-like ATP-grasp enzyme